MIIFKFNNLYNFVHYRNEIALKAIPIISGVKFVSEKNILNMYYLGLILKQ